MKITENATTLKQFRLNFFAEKRNRFFLQFLVIRFKERSTTTPVNVLEERKNIKMG